MKNSRKLDSPKRSIIDKKKKRLVNTDSHDNENSDVLVSAVISPYLLTHLHHILQQSEYYAQKDGRKSHAANFAKLRKVLCLDARSMADASAKEIKDADNDLPSFSKYFFIPSCINTFAILLTVLDSLSAKIVNCSHINSGRTT